MEYGQDCINCKGTGEDPDSDGWVYNRENHYWILYNDNGEVRGKYDKQYCFTCHGTKLTRIKTVEHNCTFHNVTTTGSNGIEAKHECCNCSRHFLEQHGNYSYDEDDVLRIMRNIICNEQPYFKACENCNGTGITLDGNKEVICKTCNGTKGSMTTKCSHGYAYGSNHKYVKDDYKHKSYVYYRFCNEEDKGYYCCGPINELIDCTTCGGTGYTERDVNGSGEQTKSRVTACNICKGTGKMISSKSCNNSEHKHIASTYEAQYKWDDGIECETCNGEGTIALSKWQEMYPDKNPNDYERYYCFDCYGSGKKYTASLKPCSHGYTSGSHKCCIHIIARDSKPGEDKYITNSSNPGPGFVRKHEYQATWSQF